MKRISAFLVAASLTLTVAAPALAESVTDHVYGVPACEKGRAVGNKHCRPQDVAQEHFAVQSIANVVASGIMKGTPEGDFLPQKTLSRGESVTVMLRVLGVQPEVGTGGQHWAAPALQKAAEAGLVESPAEDPEKPMTRADMAVLIAKALKIEPIDEPVPFADAQDQPLEVRRILAALYKAGVFKGYPDGTFKPGKVLTRAELAILVDRILARFKQ